MAQANSVPATAWSIGLAVAGMVFALTVPRARETHALIVAVVAGGVVALVNWAAGDHGFRTAASILAIALAVPLFRTWQSDRSLSNHQRVHDVAWSTGIAVATAGVFVGATLAIAHLIAALFALIGIEGLTRLLRVDGVHAMLVGAALGAGIGILRDREPIIRTTRRIVQTAGVVLGVPLAVALMIFLAFLPFTGLEPLWATTKATTPTVLFVMGLAFLFANAGIGVGDEPAAPNTVVRLSNMALGAALLPLGVIAAVSTGKRVAQYGYTPERLWAVTLTVGAVAIGLAYLVTLVRRRGGWAAAIRQANVRLAAAFAVIALLLSTPVLDFDRLSARDQVARLTSGRTAPDRFDWAALRFDFGEPGYRALERLAAGGPFAARAKAALAQRERGMLDRERDTAAGEALLAARLVIRPAGARLDPALSSAIVGAASPGDDYSGLAIVERPDFVVLVAKPCERCTLTVARWRLRGGTWVDATADWANERREVGRFSADAVTQRDTTLRQIIYDGQPVGLPYRVE